MFISGTREIIFVTLFVTRGICRFALDYVIIPEASINSVVNWKGLER